MEQNSHDNLSWNSNQQQQQLWKNSDALFFLPLSLLKRQQIALIKLTQTPFNSKCARAFIGWKPKKTTTTKRCITCFGYLLHVFYPFGRKKKTRTNVCAEYLQKEAVPTGNWKRRFLMRRFFFVCALLLIFINYSHGMWLSSCVRFILMYYMNL